MKEFRGVRKIKLKENGKKKQVQINQKSSTIGNKQLRLKLEQID